MVFCSLFFLFLCLFTNEVREMKQRKQKEQQVDTHEILVVGWFPLCFLSITTKRALFPFAYLRLLIIERRTKEPREPTTKENVLDGCVLLCAFSSSFLMLQWMRETNEAWTEWRKKHNDTTSSPDRGFIMCVLCSLIWFIYNGLNEVREAWNEPNKKNNNTRMKSTKEQIK